MPRLTSTEVQYTARNNDLGFLAVMEYALKKMEAEKNEQGQESLCGMRERPDQEELSTGT
ncbi:hypothetical protein [Phascolarctobacterium sp.]|uniref:hypothetical protein n=1 Tax=Phascolarctobacterium sp. TaxID=2049039 RepID=UPI00386966B6